MTGDFVRLFFVQVLLLTSIIALSGQAEALPGSVDTIDNVLRHDHFDSSEGFYLFRSAEQSEFSRLVVFVHGYGALNPMIYGNWIEHLVSNGNAVLFPRYQMSLFNPGTEEFVPNTVKAIKSALELIAALELPVSTDRLYLTGHSYGGVIVANIAASYADNSLPRPAVAFMCEPGHGPFRGGVLDSYNSMDEDLLLAIIVGDDDWTVGERFGEFVYNSAHNVSSRVFYRQFADNNGEESIGASHYEPYSFCRAFDNGITNFTVRRAEAVSELNNVDTEGYWAILDTLIQKATEDDCQVEPHVYESLARLGNWSDGTSVRPMEVLYPSDLDK